MQRSGAQSQDALKVWCNQEIVPNKMPRIIILVTDSMPGSRGDKIDVSNFWAKWATNSSFDLFRLQSLTENCQSDTAICRVLHRLYLSSNRSWLDKYRLWTLQSCSAHRQGVGRKCTQTDTVCEELYKFMWWRELVWPIDSELRNSFSSTAETVEVS